jgi:hypothetical protein
MPVWAYKGAAKRVRRRGKRKRRDVMKLRYWFAEERVRGWHGATGMGKK